ncbi:amidohydrolase [Jiulongibacter sediminis]|jgi:amidohydrolase|uniref:amidohydrolase n=1 Tax=Jiulongibacter sediminis TaxID=1605367 RepID=UPI0026ED4A30|nr:amidohydrolase [Jiulongibacter sediminis]
MKRNRKALISALLLTLLAFQNVKGQESLKSEIENEVAEIELKVIQWRRDFHEHPELGNQEFRTAEIIAEHLKSLGLEVTEGVAKTGVVGLLKGAKEGPVIALRADMDALPVIERVDLPFKSEVKTIYNGSETGVMHACGHDSHMAILMGAAEILAKHRDELKGTVKFIFQPAEEGVFGEGIRFGADLMVAEGVLENPKVDVAFGLHINSQTPAGQIHYRPGPTMAGVDQFYITVKGKQTHGAYPWSGVDPVSTASQVVMGLNTIVSRNVKLIDQPAVVSVGSIHGGNRHNIIPEEVKLVGTIRTLGVEQRELVHRRIKEIAENIAKSAGATAEVLIEPGYPVTENDPALSAQMLPSLKEAAGDQNVIEKSVVMGSEDFSYFAREVPGLFFFLGGMAPSMKPEEAPAHHTPDFRIDESGFGLGVKVFCFLVLDYQNK